MGSRFPSASRRLADRGPKSIVFSFIGLKMKTVMDVPQIGRVVQSASPILPGNIGGLAQPLPMAPTDYAVRMSFHRNGASGLVASAAGNHYTATAHAPYNYTIPSAPSAALAPSAQQLAQHPPPVAHVAGLSNPRSCAPPIMVSSTHPVPSYLVPNLHPRGVPVNVSFNYQSADTAPVPDCAICLGTGGPGVAQVLSCGHKFCRSCISQYAQHQAREHRIARCPECQRELTENELAACLPDSTLDRLLQALAESQHEGDVTGEQQDDDDEHLRRAFERAARRAHLKCCPQCRAPIFKDGGCDHMQCRCGHRFNWSQADTLFPCNEVHAHPDIPLWGTVCGNSTWSARMRLFLRRAGLITVGTCVVLPIVVCIGATIAVVWVTYTVAGNLVGAVCTGAANCLEGARKTARRQRRRIKRTCCC